MLIGFKGDGDSKIAYILTLPLQPTLFIFTISVPGNRQSFNLRPKTERQNVRITISSRDEPGKLT